MILRSRFFFWGCLAILVATTVVTWQFRFVETGEVFWQDRPIGDIATWKSINGGRRGQAMTTLEGTPVMSFSPEGPGQPSNAAISWEVTRSPMIKVAVRHTSPNGIRRNPEPSWYPGCVFLQSYQDGSDKAFDDIGMVAFYLSVGGWETNETVIPVTPGTQKLRVGISAAGQDGAYQISNLTVVGVRSARWFPWVVAPLWGLWGSWFLWAVHRCRTKNTWKHPTSVIAMLWILLWSGLLVFPRNLDSPRPFFTSFWSGKDAVETIQASRFIPAPSQAERPNHSQAAIGSKPDKNEVKKPFTHRIREWFGGVRGGRFLMHFGTMGIFAGGLLIILPLRSAWPFILVLAIGIEIVPWILIGTADLADLYDASAYLLGIALGIPIAGKVRNFILFARCRS